MSALACRANLDKLTPPINKNFGAIISGDSLGVLHSLPRQLREGVALDHGATLLLAESVLLAVGSVPDPVNKQIGDIEECKEEAVPVVLGGVVISQIDSAVAVAQRHASQVPEDEHETPLLVVHVPNFQVSCTISRKMRSNTYQVETMHSSPLEHALAYKKWAMTRNITSPET